MNKGTLTRILAVLNALLMGEQCDHAVGICFCEAFAVRDAVARELADRYICAWCDTEFNGTPAAHDDTDSPVCEGCKDHYEGNCEPAEDNLTDAEADADTLASAGYGTDEDYGDFGGNDE